MDYNKIMQKARKINAKRDAIDRKAGFGAPPDGPLDLYIRTAMGAINAGISLEDWDCIAEGQAMLEEIELIVRLQLNPSASRKIYLKD